MTDWLIDKSALVRLDQSSDVEEWARRLERGLVRISTVTLLEVGFSAKSGKELRDGREDPSALLDATGGNDTANRKASPRGSVLAVTTNGEPT